MLGDKASSIVYIEELARVLKPGGKMIVSTLHPENFFVINSTKIADEHFFFEGKEVDKDVQQKLELYIPRDEESFANLFPESCQVDEIGFWDNVYCGVHGKHYCALVTKK